VNCATVFVGCELRGRVGGWLGRRLEIMQPAMRREEITLLDVLDESGEADLHRSSTHLSVW